MADQDYEDTDLWDSSYEDEDCDAESLASVEEDDQNDGYGNPEKILAEARLPPTKYKYNLVWYLIKWQNFPVIRSSWENIWNLELDDTSRKSILDDWEEEKLAQTKGDKAPFDVQAFSKAVEEAEDLDKARRNLRRWKRQVKGVLAAIKGPD